MHNEIVIYQSEMLSSHMEVRIEDETVWLTQLQMATLPAPQSRPDSYRD